MNNPNSIDFSHNWNNKLYNDYFTTLRLSARFEVGQKVEVWLKKDCIGAAEIVGKKSLYLDQISDWIALLDTGYPAEETKGILKTMYPTINNWGTRPIYYYLVRFTSRLNERPNKPAPVAKPADLFT